MLLVHTCAIHVTHAGLVDLQIQIGNRITQLNKFDPTERIRKLTILKAPITMHV